MITILMAAYNSEKYIGDQIQSILNQTYNDWKLIIRDDGSVDNTWNLVNQYAQKYPDRIILLPKDENSGSAANNFFLLMSMADGEYTMFCDHDDIWLPNKIQVTIDKMHELETRFGVDVPLLVHTDLIVVDSNLHQIAKSMFEYQGLDPSRNSLNYLLVQNVVSGCTTMVNRKLLEVAGMRPTLAVMHDWWLALIASAFGYIGCVMEPTIMYRQHSTNVVGAKQKGKLPQIIKRLKHYNMMREDFHNLFLQASDFLNQYQNKLTKHLIKMLEDFVSVPSLCIYKRFRIFYQHCIWKKGIFKKVGQIFLSRYN